MANPKNAKNLPRTFDHSMLNLLSAVESDTNLSQRLLAKRIGTALGLVNSLLKRAVNKGLVKVKEAPAKRFAYYITPKGFNEKSRLVAEYLTTSLSFFRQAREEFDEQCAMMVRDGRQRVMLYGAGELAEIAILSLQQSELELLGVIEPGSNLSRIAGVPVCTAIEMASADEVDAVVLSATNAPQESYEALLEHVNADRVYVVPLLHVSRQEH